MDMAGPKRKSFGGASTSRLYYDWKVANVSPDYELRGALRILRARARQLVQDNPYASGFAEELANNVVGPKGIRIRPDIRTQTDAKHKAANAAIKAAWKDWNLPENASADGHDSWVDLQRLILQTIAIDGECFLRRRMYFDNAHGFALQIIDADQVDETFNRKAEPTANQVVMGVEINADGRAVAYHIRTQHPSDGLITKRERVSADEIKHLFIRYRANQHRGVTWYAPVLTGLKMHDGYSEAELVAARVAAAQMGFFVTKDPSLATATLDPNAEDTQEITEAAPGTFGKLEPGQELQMFDPKHPNAAFDAFTKVILRGIARGLGISYIALTGDLLGVSYSSIRAGVLPERDRWRALQNWFAIQCHRWVYQNWIQCATLTGALLLDSRLTADFSNVDWKPRGWAMRTTYTSDKILNLYRATTFTAPAAVYAGLLTAVTDAEAGTVTETSYGSYARQAITFGAPARAWAATNASQRDHLPS
jgi:lambda family phage portal protein